MPPKTGVCRLCNETRRFVNSYVIPAAFYDNLAPRTLEESEESATVRSFSTSGRAINIRLGVYGQFLCGACEVLFQQVDNYAVALFRDQQHPPDPATDHVFVGDDSIDIVTIRLFVLATLWRASVCEHPFFDKASLGPLESVYRDLLWTSLNGIGVIPEQVGAIEMQIHVVKFPDAPVLLPPSRYETPSQGRPSSGCFLATSLRSRL